MKPVIHIKALRILGCSTLLLTCLCGPVLAGDFNNLLDLSLEELGEIRVSIATGAPKSLTDVPAGTSLITADDLQAMGARTLEDALQTVPGLYVSRSSLNYAPKYFFRGIVSSYNPQALMLVNGLPMSSLFLGDRGLRMPGQYSVPVNIIERIEIIRGPGSALYGADAFAGVINVITKGPDDLDSTAASFSAGSFDTVRASLMQPMVSGNLQAALLLSYQTSNGDRDAIIERDAQSNIDQLALAPPASRAPGPADTSFEYYDARLDLRWNEFQLTSAWSRVWNIGNGNGINYALDPDGRYKQEQGSLDFSWTSDDVFDKTRVKAELAYTYGTSKASPITTLLPAGTIFGAFPDGVIGVPTLAENGARFEISARYNGFVQHTVLIGSGYIWGDLFKTTDLSNARYVNGVPVPRPQFVDTSDTNDIFQPEAQRTSVFVYAQDEWRISPTWELVTGIRFDEYDDVGSALNPRLALVWHSTDTLTSKLMYGEAFRVPAFSELYVTSNPVAMGNPSLEPEKLKNTELGFAWQPADSFSSTLNLYYFRIDDYIDFVEEGISGIAVAHNFGRIDGHGAELELRHQLSEQWQWLGNYSFQKTRDRDTDEALGLAPEQTAYLRLQWAKGQWQITPQLTLVGKRPRQTGDPRADLEGYVSFDLNARRQLNPNLSIALLAHNLFDADIREPSNGPGINASLPDIWFDLPQQGRSLMLELDLLL